MDNGQKPPGMTDANKVNPQPGTGGRTADDIRATKNNRQQPAGGSEQRKRNPPSSKD